MPKSKNTRTTATLRDILFDEIDAVREDGGDIGRAKAIAGLSKEILGTARLELQFQDMTARLQREGASVDFRPLALGAK